MNGCIKILRLGLAVVFTSVFLWLGGNFFLSGDQISETENRVLSSKPHLLQNGQWNYSIGNQIEKFLKEHFPARQGLIRTQFELMYKLNNKIENKKAFLGFDKHEIISISPLIKQKKNVKIRASTLKRLDDFFEGKNMPIYVVIVPDREVLYQKYWEKYYPPKKQLDYEQELSSALQDHPNIKFIPIKDKLSDLAEKELVFYQDDVHLTPLAQSFITKEVFQYLKKEGILENDVVLHEDFSHEKQEHVASIAASLGIRGKTTIDLPIVSLSLEGLHSTITEDRQFEVLSDNGYKGEIISPVMRAENPEAPINKLGIFLGPCDTEEAYDVLNPLFVKSVKIRPNVAEMGGEAVFMVHQSFEELSVEKDSAVMIMIIPPDTFQVIEDNLLMQ